jgi:hypothetical protein
MGVVPAPAARGLLKHVSANAGLVSYGRGRGPVMRGRRPPACLLRCRCDGDTGL